MLSNNTTEFAPNLENYNVFRVKTKFPNWTDLSLKYWIELIQNLIKNCLLDSNRHRKLQPFRETWLSSRAVFQIAFNPVESKDPGESVKDASHWSRRKSSN